MKAIEMGVVTETTRSRMLELEAEQARLTGRIAAEQADIVQIDREDMIAGLKVFRDGNVKDKKYQARLFDTFLIAVFLYDDGLKLVFGFPGGKHTIDIPLDDILADDVEEDIIEGKVRLGASSLHQSSARRTTPSIYMVDGLFVLALPLYHEE
jgi:hypothetical protein